MKTFNFKELKARKNGEVTPQSLSENLLEEVSKGQIQRVIYVVMDNNGYIHVGYNSGSNLEALGMIENARQDLIDEMRE